MTQSDEREKAADTLAIIDETLADVGLNTDQLGDFWLAMTEGCTLRLVRLKPEMVRMYRRGEE